MSEEIREDAQEEFEIDLGELDNDQLVDFEAALVEEYGKLRGAELTEEFSATDRRRELTAIKNMIASVRDEMTARQEEAEGDDFVAEVRGESFAAAVGKVNVEAAAEEAEKVEEEEAASEEAGAEDVKISPAGLEGDSKVTPEEEAKAFNVVASADVRGYKAGDDYGDWFEVARAMVSKRQDIRGSDKGSDGNRFLVASVMGDYPDERTLGSDVDANMAKIEAVTSQEAITASGGLCAPLTPYYQLTVYGDAHRPVRDALPAFKADRGGIRFVPAPVLGDLSGSVRHTTAAQDAAGYTNQTPSGETAPKPCLHVTCEGEQTAVVEAIHRCLTFGNLGARTYPEQVEAWIKLGMAEYARYAETRLLDGIRAASTGLTADQVYGATFSFLEQIALVVTSFRARHRLSQNARFRALLPFWAVEIIKSDIAAQAPGDGLSRFSISDAQVRDWFESRGVTVTWYQDHSTAAGAPFAAPQAGPLWAWPEEIEWFVYPEGSFLYLDSGSLDLGLVRDSTLNSQNDYQIFYEEFAAVTFIGAEAYRVTSTLCANGAYAPSAEALRECAGS